MQHFLGRSIRFPHPIFTGRNHYITIRLYMLYAIICESETTNRNLLAICFIINLNVWLQILYSGELSCMFYVSQINWSSSLIILGPGSLSLKMLWNICHLCQCMYPFSFGMLCTFIFIKNVSSSKYLHFRPLTIQQLDQLKLNSHQMLVNLLPIWQHHE